MMREVVVVGGRGEEQLETDSKLYTARNTDTGTNTSLHTEIVEQNVQYLMKSNLFH